MVFPKKIAAEYDLSSTIRKDGISFSRKYAIFSRRKVKDAFLKKSWKYDVFYVFGKDGAFFPTNMKLPFCQKSKDYLLPKNTLKNGVSGITKKGDAHPSKDDIGIGN